MGAARSPTGASPAVLAGKSRATQTPSGPERVVLGRRKRGQQRVRVCLDERGHLVASSGLESREEPVVSQTMRAAVCATFAVVTWWLSEFLEGAGHLLPACRCCRFPPLGLTQQGARASGFCIQVGQRAREQGAQASCVIGDVC